MEVFGISASWVSPLESRSLLRILETGPDAAFCVQGDMHVHGGRGVDHTHLLTHMVAFCTTLRFSVHCSLSVHGACTVYTVAPTIDEHLAVVGWKTNLCLLDVFSGDHIEEMEQDFPSL